MNKPQPIMVAFSDRTEGEGAIVNGKRYTTHTYILDGKPLVPGEHIEILSLNGVFIQAIIFAQNVAEGLVVGIPITTVYGVDMIKRIPLTGGTIARRVEVETETESYEQ